MTTPPGRTPDSGHDPDDPSRPQGRPPRQDASPGEPTGPPYPPGGGSPYGPPHGSGPGGGSEPPGGGPYQPGGPPYGSGPGGGPYQPGGPPYGTGPGGGLPYPPPYTGQPGSPAGQPPYGWGGYPPSPGAPGAGDFGGPGAPWGEPTRKRSNRMVFVIAGVLVAVLAISVWSVVTLRGGSPRRTADRFLTALQTKDVEKAHDLLCSDGKRKKSVDQLRTDFELRDHTITSYVITSDSKTRERDNKQETLVDATLTYETGDTVPVQIGVWSEGGQKICSLQPPAR
jgi:hypothetical protein